MIRGLAVIVAAVSAMTSTSTAIAAAPVKPPADVWWSKSMAEIFVTGESVFPLTLKKPYRWYTLPGDAFKVGCWGIGKSRRIAGISYYQHLGCDLEVDDYADRLLFYRMVITPLDNEGFFLVSGAHRWNP